MEKRDFFQLRQSKARKSWQIESIQPAALTFPFENLGEELLYSLFKDEAESNGRHRNRRRCP
jgi:hypothetical protein